MSFPSTQSIPFWSLIMSLHFHNHPNWRKKKNNFENSSSLSVDFPLLCMRRKWGISAPHSRRRNQRRNSGPTPSRTHRRCPFWATDGLECALSGGRRPENRWVRNRLLKWRRSSFRCRLIGLLRSGTRPPVRRIEMLCRGVRVLGLARSLTLSFSLISFLIRFRRVLNFIVWLRLMWIMGNSCLWNLLWYESWNCELCLGNFKFVRVELDFWLLSYGTNLAGDSLELIA